MMLAAFRQDFDHTQRAVCVCAHYSVVGKNFGYIARHAVSENKNITVHSHEAEAVHTVFFYFQHRAVIFNDSTVYGIGIHGF